MPHLGCTLSDDFYLDEYDDDTQLNDVDSDSDFASWDDHESLTVAERNPLLTRQRLY